MFLSVFGDPDTVQRGLQEYWQDKGSFTSPAEIYNFLMDKKVAEGAISQHVAKNLKTTFKDSFSPEHSTGFHSAHREPVISALARLYAQTSGHDSPVWHIEGDIGNLSGLNTAMNKAAAELQASDPQAFNGLLQANAIKAEDAKAAEKLGRAMADRVMYAICQITANRLQTKCDTVGIRTGGDEFTVIATSQNNPLNEKAIKTLLRDAQRDVAAFVTTADLTLVPHGRDRRKIGVGVGLAPYDLRYATRDEHLEIEAGLTRSKDESDRILHGNKRKMSNMEMQPVNLTALSQALSGYPLPIVHTASPQQEDYDPSRVPPESARQNALLQKLGAKYTELSAAEQKAINATIALTRENDIVVNLPMFGNMSQTQLPYFRKVADKEDKGPRLINIDFSNMAGGNKLGYEVGDAMARRFRDVTIGAMLKTKLPEVDIEGKTKSLADFLPFLAARPGGKFALLLPDSVSDDVLNSFRINLEAGLKAVSMKPLDLGQDKERIIRDIRQKAAWSAEKGNDDFLAKTFGANLERLQTAKGEIEITLDKIVAQNSGVSGSSVVMTHTPQGRNLDYNLSLRDQMEPLEVEARTLQDAITSAHADAAHGGGRSFVGRELAKKARTGGGLPPH